MTNSQQPFDPGQPGYFPPAQQPPVGPPVGQPEAPPNGPRKRGNILTSKPGIGIAALVVGLVLGSAAGAAGKPTSASTAAAAPTVTATAEASSEPAEEPAPEPSEEPSDEPTEEAPVPTDTSFRWGGKVGFSYEDVEITVRVDDPKASTNTFDRDNLEAKLTVCNKGTETIDEMSAAGLGLYAEDKSDGQYDLYGPYRTPEFPVYSWDSAKLKPGKCRTGWVSFEDGSKAIRIATEVSDTTYSWSKSGK